MSDDRKELDAALEWATRELHNLVAAGIPTRDLKVLIAAARAHGDAEKDAATLRGLVAAWIEADDALSRASFLCHDDPTNEQNKKLAWNWTRPLHDAKEALRASLSHTPKEGA